MKTSGQKTGGIAPSARRRNMAAMALCIVALLSFEIAANAQTIRFEVFDGQQYAPEQLPLAARSPVQNAVPQLSNGDYMVPRSADGQYHITGRINGFPVVFLVDTGASITAIPVDQARNAGIRAGQQALMTTANGETSAWTSSGNVLHVGGYTVNAIDVQVVDRLRYPLLGMNVLNRFQIGYANGYMVIRTPR